ncbi:hypothetical protein [Microbacterium sp. NPDC055683]
MGDDEELAALRRRIYGRDAGLAADEAALVRLAELEGRRMSAPVVDAEPATGEKGGPDRAPAESIERVSTDDALSEPAAPARRGLPLGWGAVALGMLGVLAFAAGLSASHAARPRPLAELSADRAVDGIELPMRTSEEGAAVVEAYPAFASLELAVGTDAGAPAESAVSCLLAGEDSGGSFEPEHGVCRAGGGGFPLEIVGVVRPVGARDGDVALDGPEVDDLPDGTRVRFLLVGDRIEVWLDGAEGRTS